MAEQNINQGKDYLKLGLNEEGLSSAKNAYQIAPHLLTVVDFYLRCLFLCEFYNDAHSIALEYLEKYPESAQSHYLVGLSCFYMNRFSEAQEYFKRSLDFDENNEFAYSMMSLASEMASD